MSDNLPNLNAFDSTTSSMFGGYVPDGVPESDAKNVDSMDFSNWYASSKENDLLRTLMNGPILGKSVELISGVQNQVSDVLNLVNNNVPLLKNQISDTLVDRVLFNRTLWMVLILIVVFWMVWRYFKKSQ